MFILRPVVALLVMSFLSLSVYADAELSSDKQKLSYAMGALFSQNLDQKQLELDIPAFLQAIEDSLKNAEPKMTTQEMQEILTKFQEEESKQLAALAEKNLADGKKFLEENKGKEGVTELPSGLQYKIVSEGDGEKPTADSTVTVHYRGMLLDGTEFDSSYSRGEPIELQLARVIKGWQEALPLMKVNSKWQIYVPADLAYGTHGAGTAIGPNAALIFDIELISIN